MNVVRRFTPKKTLALLDPGSRRTTAAIVRPSAGAWLVAGTGVSASRGIEAGQVRHLGDAVETVVEALKAAEREAGGLRADELYYAYDDDAIESVLAQGSVSLKGEGEIRPADVRQLRRSTERLVSSFEKHVVYSHEIRFLIDDRDAVQDPVGVFGTKLDVELRALVTRSERHDAWTRVMERAHLRRAVPVASAWASAAAVIAPAEESKRLLVVNGREGLVSVSVARGGGICEHKTLRSDAGRQPRELAENLARAAEEWKSQGLDGCVLTGLLPDDPQWLSLLSDFLELTVESRKPSLGRLRASEEATLAGLATVAAELEASFPALRADKGLFVTVRQKAESFLNEYF